MRNLVPIKITIGIKQDGAAQYPDFNTLASVQASGMDWSRYVDVEGLGWHYDSCCGHKTDTVDSPFGQQFGILITPKAFADEAIVAFPLVVFKQTKLETQVFYDTHVTQDQPEQEIDGDILTAIKIHRDLGLVDEAWMTRAIDPTTDDRGIRKNTRKFWRDYSALVGVVIVQ